MITYTPKTNKVVGDALRMVRDASLVGLDIETTDLHPGLGYIRLIQLTNGQKTYLIDCRKNNPLALLEALSKVGTVVAHGADFEWRWIYHHYGVELDNLVDTMLLAQILAAGDKAISCGLGALADREFGVELDKDMQGADWSVEKLTKRHLDYAAMDAHILLPLYAKLIGYIVEEGLDRVAKIENACLPAVARMKLEGMPVHREAWKAHAEALESRLRALERKMLEDPALPERETIPQQWQLTGPDCLAMLHDAGLTDATGTTARDLAPVKHHELVKRLLKYRATKGDSSAREDAKAAVYKLAPIKPAKPAPPWNFGSHQQVAEIAYKLIGFSPRDTSEGTLLRYTDKHPFFSQMLEHRSLKKRVSTYGKAWFKDAYDEERGRVYPAWWQIGTSTGRFACSEPNAQNLPNDGPYRSFFEAPAGRMFVVMDYSQIEVRIAAKMLGVKALLNLYEEDATADVYKATAANMLNVKREDVSKEQRQLAKAIMLGMIYGLSAKGLPEYAWKYYEIRDMSPQDAQEYVDAFYALYPEIEDYHERVTREINETGSLDQRTMTGRLRAGITVRNEGINAPVQGTAADGLKAAMAKVYQRLKKFNGTAFIIATLHDELLIECDESDGDEVAGIVKEAMLEAMDEIVNSSEPAVPILVEGKPMKVWAKN